MAKVEDNSLIQEGLQDINQLAKGQPDTPMTEKEIRALEETVEQSLIEAELHEKMVESIEIEAEMNKFREKEKKQNKNLCITESDIYSYLVNLDKSIIDLSREILDSDREEFNTQIAIYNKVVQNGICINEVKGKHNKIWTGFIILGVLVGIAIGMQDNIWLPYIGNVIDGVRALLSWSK